MRNRAKARGPQVIWWLLALILLGPFASAWSQSKSPGAPGALAILKRAAHQYSNLKSYRITRRQTFLSRLGHTPSPTTMSAIRAPGGRYRFQGSIGFGTAVRISNGKFVWVYHPTQNAFTCQPATAKEPVSPKVMPVDDEAIEGAEKLVQSLTWSSWSKRHFKSATRLPDENLTFNGRTLKCYVIELTNKDQKNPGPYPFTDKIWIEKGSFKIRKIVEHYITFSEIKISVFPQVILNQPIPDSVFRFTPPPTALWVAQFCHGCVYFRSSVFE